MVPISFENITRAAGLDALNSFPVSETARATHESFETHLQRANTTSLADLTRPIPPREEPRREPEPRNASEPPHRESVRQESDNQQRDDVDIRQEDSTRTAAAREAAKTGDDQEETSEREESAGDEVTVTSGTEEQRAVVKQLETDAANEADEAVAKQSIAERNDALQQQGQSEEQADFEAATTAALDDAVAADKQQQADTRATKDELNGQQGQLDRKAAEQTDNKPTLDIDLETSAGVAAQNTNVDAKAAADEAATQATSIAPRRSQRPEIAPTESVDTTQEATAKSLEAAVSTTRSDQQGDRDSASRNPQQGVPTAQAVGNSAQTDQTLETAGVPSRFAEHLLAKTGDPNARALNITNADQTRFIDRVARAVQATGDRGGTIRLRLSPPELGALTLEVKVQNGAVSARVEADTPAARTLLLENLPVLRERLAEQGMRVDQFDVDLTDRHTGGTPEDLQQNDRQRDEHPRGETPIAEADDPPPSNNSQQSTTTGNEQLNIIV